MWKRSQQALKSFALAHLREELEIWPRALR
jgi:hypothetical protein